MKKLLYILISLIFIGCTKNEIGESSITGNKAMVEDQLSETKWYLTSLPSNLQIPIMYNGPFISDSVPLPPDKSSLTFFTDSIVYFGITLTASFNISYAINNSIKTIPLHLNQTRPASWIDALWDSDVVSSLDSAYQMKIQNQLMTIYSAAAYNISLQSYLPSTNSTGKTILNLNPIIPDSVTGPNNINPGGPFIRYN